MNASEFVACRQTIGLTPHELAAELGITPHVLSAIESGDVRVPKRFARELAWRAAIITREAFLTSAGHPPCTVATELERTLQPAFASGNTDEILRLGEAFTAHTEGCATCVARKQYADEHAPPLPEPPRSLPIRAFDAINGGLDKLPGVLRPPAGAGGDARRTAVLIGAILSLLVLSLAILAALTALVSTGWRSDWWKEPLATAVVVPAAYLVGFYLAGWAFDATRSIRYQLLGYVVRGALSVGAIYGTIGFSLPVLDRASSLNDWSRITASFACIGAVGGGILWVIRRVRGKIPKRVGGHDR